MYASAAVDRTGCMEQKQDKQLKGLRCKLLRNRDELNEEDRAELDHLLSRIDTSRTEGAWSYREQLQDILQRKQVNVVRAML